MLNDVEGRWLDGVRKFTSEATTGATDQLERAKAPIGREVARMAQELDLYKGYALRPHQDR
jgi:hypothetical protein